MAESKLTAATTAAICRYLRDGLNRETACQLAGISARSGRRWLERAEKTRETDPGQEDAYTAYADACQLAEDEFEQRQLARIEAAAENSKTWTAAAWLLERRHPERWSLRDTRIRLLNADGESVTVNVSFTGTTGKANDADGNAETPDAPL